MLKSGTKRQATQLPTGGKVGPYSDVVAANGFYFLSGRIGLDDNTMKLIEGGISEQTSRCIDNIANVLKIINLDLDDVIKTTVFLTTMNDFDAMNVIYDERFSKPAPARSTVAVSELPLRALVEIEVIAVSR